MLAMKKMAVFILFAVALAATGAEPSLRIALDREKIYLGESLVVEVTLQGVDKAPQEPPVFSGGTPAEISYRGPRSFSQSYISIVNGRREAKLNTSTIFTFVFTPKAAGSFATGAATLSAGGRTLRAPSAGARVIAPETPDFVKLSLGCADRVVTVESRFRIDVEIGLRALSPPYAEVEPFEPRRPLRLSAAFLDFPETQGLRTPDADATLSPLVARSASLPFFAINGYQQSAFPNFGGLDPFAGIGSAFQETPIHFRPNPERRTIDGAAWWFYSFSVEYQASEEGEFTFGPLALKGAVAVDSNGGGQPELREIFATAPAITVKATPPPEEGRPEWFSGAVGRSMAAKASLDTSKCKVGDPLTLTLDISGDVNAASIRPPVLSAQRGMPDCFRFYDDHIESETVQGGKRFKYRLRPLKAGTLELPPVRTAFFNSLTGEYETVLTDPIPVQVEATAQISVVESDGGDGGGGVVPDAMILAPSDDFVIRGIPVAGEIDAAKSIAGQWPAWLLLPPSLWLLFIGVLTLSRAVRRDLEATRHACAARRALRRFGRVVRSGLSNGGRIAEAVSAARAFAAATLEEESASLTAGEMRQKFSERGFGDDIAGAFARAFAALEGVAFSAGGAGGAPEGAAAELAVRIAAVRRESAAAKRRATGGGATGRPFGAMLRGAIETAAALAIAAVAVGTVAGAPGRPARNIIQHAPDRFEWERAQSALASAGGREDFAAAARLYAEIAGEKVSTGPLYHNMGVALLLSGEPKLAAMALNRAAVWRGASAEVRNNRMAAEEAASGSPALPPSFFVFFWHYMVHVKWRIAGAAAAWCLAWLLAMAAAAPRLRRAAWACAAVSFAVAVALSCSVAAASSCPAEPLPTGQADAVTQQAEESPAIGKGGA